MLVTNCHSICMAKTTPLYNSTEINSLSRTLPRLQPFQSFYLFICLFNTVHKREQAQEQSEQEQEQEQTDQEQEQEQAKQEQEQAQQEQEQAHFKNKSKNKQSRNKHKDKHSKSKNKSKLSKNKSKNKNNKNINKKGLMTAYRQSRANDRHAANPNPQQLLAPDQIHINTFLLGAAVEEPTEALDEVSILVVEEAASSDEGTTPPTDSGSNMPENEAAAPMAQNPGLEGPATTDGSQE
ncbi:hypothetical protein BCR41DRAFT_370196 [Lobosporangium transversale]|uniref:Uncharacterized protein n=1 Tax=Lobosporangium transversale TaxID=64571 RepID=A0A1Y2GSE5_9FUNG|nr:hypothetical protein BCR41DRAFT_370196 [Lobosporangium transversale]ORZ18405.1 hypothetical protein BCR41DRAFT_370196 [Lobosporangium transversale]|eukprot:XP_021882200.1 hypothetical protein BCR41DRAFT_370196 [Lobosporangium transversale]